MTKANFLCSAVTIYVCDESYLSFYISLQIYWVAPIVGGLLATCTYQLLFAWKRTNHSASENDIHNVEIKNTNENLSPNFVTSL